MLHIISAIESIENVTEVVQFTNAICTDVMRQSCWFCSVSGVAGIIPTQAARILLLLQLTTAGCFNFNCNHLSFPRIFGFFPTLVLQRKEFVFTVDRSERKRRQKKCVFLEKRKAHMLWRQCTVTIPWRNICAFYWGIFFCFFRLCMCIHMRIGPGTPSFSHLIRRKKPPRLLNSSGLYLK